MFHNQPAILESLESRTFFSVSPTVLADRQAILDDRAALKADLLSGKSTLIADRTAIKEAKLVRLEDVRTLRLKLKSDRLNALAILANGKAQIRQFLLNELKTLSADLKNIRASIHNPTALAAARATFSADKIKYKNDKASTTVDVKNFLASTAAKLAADRQAIHESQITDTPAILAAKQTLATDLASIASKLADDRSKLVTDLQKLASDIKNHV